MENFEDCQFPLLHEAAGGTVDLGRTTLKNEVKRRLASPWNHTVKIILKRAIKKMGKVGVFFALVPATKTTEKILESELILAAGDWVRIKPLEEIQATLDRWKEVNGCAFLHDMSKYCGTEQQVLKPVTRFLDERDYKVKKVKNMVILKGILCEGTQVFGGCDRGCHLFWRTEWLEKIDPPRGSGGGL